MIIIKKKTGFKKINLLGHSFDRYITVLCYLEHPQYLNRLILADPWSSLNYLSLKAKSELSLWKLALIKTMSYINHFSF